MTSLFALVDSESMACQAHSCTSSTKSSELCQGRHMKPPHSDCRERTSLTQTLLNGQEAGTLVVRGQLHSRLTALAQTCHSGMQSFGHPHQTFCVCEPLKIKHTFGYFKQCECIIFVLYNEKQYPAKNGKPSRFGLSDNFDQDTVSDRTTISLSGSWLAYHHHHQERPSDAKLYKYTDSSNLVPTISTHGLKRLLEKQVQIFVTVQKAFRKVWKPLDLWFTVQLFSDTCIKLTFMKKSSQENLCSLTTKYIRSLQQHRNKPDALWKQLL